MTVWRYQHVNFSSIFGNLTSYRFCLSCVKLHGDLACSAVKYHEYHVTWDVEHCNQRVNSIPIMVLTSIIIVYWSFFQCFAFSNLVLVKTRWLKSNPIRQLPTSPSCGLGSNNLFYYTTHQTRNNLHFPLQQTPATELIHTALQLKSPARLERVLRSIISIWGILYGYTVVESVGAAFFFRSLVVEEN